MYCFPLAVRGSCITDCEGVPDGNYQSCKGCNVYAACGGGVLYDEQPCPTSELVWDDNSKTCEFYSETCGDVGRL